MLHKGLGYVAGLAATCVIAAIIAAASQGAKHPTFLSTIIAVSVVVFVLGGWGWWITREDELKKSPPPLGPSATSSGYQTSAKSAARDLIDQSTNIFNAPPPVPPPGKPRSEPPPKAIEVHYDPDPTSNFIHLLMQNVGLADDFMAEVSEIEGAELPQKTPWNIKWRLQTTKEERRIPSGRKAHLDLCEAFPPKPGPVRDSLERGRFKFYSTTVPTGFPVSAGPRQVIVPDGTDEEIAAANAQHTPYDETLTLRVDIVAIDRNETVSKRVLLGFNPTHKKIYTPSGDLVVERIKERFRVEVEDLPEDDQIAETPARVLDGLRVRGGQIRVRAKSGRGYEGVKPEIDSWTWNVRDALREHFPAYLTRWRSTDKATTLEELVGSQIEILDEIAKKINEES